jgi:hypothetical protein
MKKSWIVALAAPAAVLAGVLLLQSRTEAADHRDSPSTTGDPAADINDLYVFRSKDPAAGATDRTVFVMTVLPLADTTSRFSDQVDYEFRIEEEAPGTATFTIKCNATSATPQVISCTGPGGASKSIEFNVVDAGSAANDDMRVFAGLRDDPFYFDLDDFKTVASSGNPAELVDNTGTDFFLAKNTLAIVVDVKNSVFGASTKLKVHAATNRTGI